MKLFLLGLVSCCGTSTFRQPAEETRTLVPPPETRRIIRRRKKVRAETEWRPSLSSISEDHYTAPPEKRKGGVAGSEINRKIRKVAAAVSRLRPPQCHDETGRTGFSTTMPTLSPTPFLF